MDYGMEIINKETNQRCDYVSLDNILDTKKTISFKDIEGGFVLIGDADTLVKVCSGVFFKIEPQGICMMGKKK